MQHRLFIYPDQTELVTAAAEMITAIIAEAIQARGACALALSGGSTPREVYEKLAHASYRERIAWPAVHWFWGDERMVPPEHEESNYRMTREALLAHAPIPARNVHRIQGELAPALAAREYRAELAAFFHQTKNAFDLVLLGLGEDGHTASLFPETAALRERTHDAAEVFVPKLDQWRVTLTLPAINRARKIIFLVAGKSKAEIAAGVLGLPQPEMKWPASLVQPSEGELLWLLDAEAAARREA